MVLFILKTCENSKKLGCYTKFAADLAATEVAAGAAESLKCKAPKTKVPFYYDNKTFAVSTSRGFIKRLEKENQNSFMSFVKQTTAPAVPVVEGNAALEVVETDLDHPESQGAQEAMVLAHVTLAVDELCVQVRLYPYEGCPHQTWS